MQGRAILATLRHDLSSGLVLNKYPVDALTDSFSGCICICTLISVQNDALCLVANQIRILNPEKQAILTEKIAAYKTYSTEFGGRLI